MPWARTRNRSIDNVSSLRHSRRTGQGEKLAFEAASGLILKAEFAEMSLPSEKSLSALLDERRTFPPSEEFKKRASWNDPAIYDRAAKDPEGFWVEEAKHLDWFAPWQRVLEWKVPWAKALASRSGCRSGRRRTGSG